ncbi:MAG TPA: recombinase family protein [Solirubrobacteraceae bacterium]|jgi:DNA invertase Pin-like site-specific DNA recombinase
MGEFETQEMIAELGLRLPDLQPGATIDISVGYVRVSSTGQLGRDGDKDGDGYSIPAQVQLVERESGNLKIHLAKVYIERAESAKSDNRPVLQRMLTELPIIKALPMVRHMHLIIPKVDRLARNRLDDALLCQQLVSWGIKLVSATENIGETPSGQLMHGMLAVFSEYYSNNLSEEVTKGLRRKHELGGTPFKPPIGYKPKRTLIGNQDIRTVILDEKRAPLVTEAFQLYATGRWSTIKLASYLTEQGLRTRPTKRSPERPMTANRIQQMLRNPYYKGTVIYKGRSCPGRHEQLVDPDTFDTVQGLLTAARIRGERPQKHEHYLRGTVVCEECYGRLLFGRHRGRSRYYDYFCCNNRTVRGRAIQCSSGHYAVERVEHEILDDVYRTLELPEQIKEQVRQELRDELAERVALIKQETARHERALKDITARQEKLVQLYYKDLVDESVFAAEQDKLKTERKAAERLRATVTAQTTDVEAALDEALNRIDNIHEAYRNSSDLERRILNRAIFVHIEIGPDGVAGTKLTTTYKALSAWHPNLGRPRNARQGQGRTPASIRPCTGQVHHARLRRI